MNQYPNFNLTKMVYLVRHGQSETAANNKHQDGMAALSELGLKQADVLAARFNNIKADYLISSNYKRAFQTAEAISKVTGLKINENDLFRERKYASEAENIEYGSKELQNIYEQINANELNQDFHYSDEENFFDLRERTIKAFKVIQELNKENIIIATHGKFLAMIICLAIFGEDFEMSIYSKFAII